MNGNVRGKMGTLTHQLCAMRQVCTIVIFLFCSFGVLAQFADPVLISPISKRVSSAIAGDMDNDGDLDVIATSQKDGKIVWYENDGIGNFPTHHLILQTEESYRRMTVADYDENGYADFVIGVHENGDTLTQLWMNYGMAPSPPVEIIIPNDFSQVEHLYSFDMDLDGFIDIILVDGGSYERACWLRNDGTGQFNGYIEIPNVNGDDIDGFHDINGDGWMDMFVENYVVVNDSAGYSFHIDTLNSAIEKVYGVGDLDLDGDLDIAAAKTESATFSSLRWFENDGTGDFSNSYEIIPSSYALESRAFTVVELDGHVGAELIAPYGNILRYTNFQETSFTTDTVLKFSGHYGQLTFHDFNGDGQDDLFLDRGLSIVFGDSTYDHWDNISHMNTLGGCRQIKVVDVNKDGYKDILGASGNGIFSRAEFLPYLGNDTYHVSSKVVSYNFGNVLNIFSGDYNGTSTEDVAMVTWNGKIGIAINDGLGNFDQASVLYEMPNDQYWASAFQDFDGDGDFDIIIVPSGNEGDIMLIRNQDGIYIPEPIIPSQYGSTPGRMETFDIENDGDLDAALVAHESEGGIAVFINDGLGHFEVIFLEETTDWYNTHVSAADFDQDGDLDLLCNHSFNFNQTVIYEYDVGSFEAHEVEVEGEHSPYITHAVDVDNDGLKDVLCFTSWMNEFHPETGPFWYKNLGNWEFSSPYLTHFDFPEISQPYDLVSLDRDHDGDEDFLLSDQGNASNNSGIFYFENLFWGSYLLQGNVFLDSDTSGDLSLGDLPFPFFNVGINPTQSAYFTNSLGEYNALMGEGAFTVIPEVDTALWQISTDFDSYTVTVDQANPIHSDLDFGFVPNGVQPNGELSLINPVGTCLSMGTMWYSLSNTGNTYLSGVIELVIDSILEFQYSQPMPDSIIGNHIYYSVDSLSYYDQVSQIISLAMPDPTWIGEILNTQVSFFDQSGVVLEQLGATDLACAYDPNDKTEHTGSGALGYVQDGQWLEYTIRFQNTGNATATDVVIRDDLDQSLKWESFAPIAWSHQPEISVAPDGEVVFDFQDIMLVDSGTSFIESQGFVKYKIKLDSNLLPGTQINNTANIYFDFNPPITTNTTINTIPCYTPTDQVVLWNDSVLRSPYDYPVSQQWYRNDTIVVGETGNFLVPVVNGVYHVEALYPVNCKVESEAAVVNNISVDYGLRLDGKVFPNPAVDYVNIELVGPLDGTASVIITDVFGRDQHSVSVSTRKLKVDLREFGPGCYFAFIEQGESRTLIGKVINTR